MKLYDFGILAFIVIAIIGGLAGTALEEDKNVIDIVKKGE